MHEEYGTEIDYFSRLDLTLLTLFQLMTLDGWVVTVREIIGIYTWAWVPLLSFITLAGICITSMIVAVICGSPVLYMINQDDEDKNELQKRNLQIIQMQQETMALRNEIKK